MTYIVNVKKFLYIYIIMSAKKYQEYLSDLENSEPIRYLKLIDSIFAASETENKITEIQNNSIASLNQQIQSLQSTLKNTPAEEKPNKIAEIKTINSQKATEENKITQLQREMDNANTNIARFGPPYDGITMNKKQSIFVDWIKNKINSNNLNTKKMFENKIKMYPNINYTSNFAKQIAETENLDLSSRTAFNSILDKKSNLQQLTGSKLEVLGNEDLSSNISSYLRGGKRNKTKKQKGKKLKKRRTNKRHYK